MSATTRAGTQAPGEHVADSHDLIRVQGARRTTSRTYMWNCRSGG